MSRLLYWMPYHGGRKFKMLRGNQLDNLFKVMIEKKWFKGTMNMLDSLCQQNVEVQPEIKEKNH